MAGVVGHDAHEMSSPLAWPMQAITRGMVVVVVAVGWDGDGGWKRCDGTVFGNGWLPNIVIIINQCYNY